jgi:hypothetical protein
MADSVSLQVAWPNSSDTRGSLTSQELDAGDYFTDRDVELKRLVQALTEPGSKLLV